MYLSVDEYVDSHYHHHSQDTDPFSHCPPNALPLFLLSPSPKSWPLATTDLFSTPIIVSFPDCHVDRIIQYAAFGSGFFHLAQCTCVSSMLLHVSRAGCALSLPSTPPHRCTAISSSSPQVRDIWVGKHDFYYLNGIPSCTSTKPYVNSSVLSMTLLYPC